MTNGDMGLPGTSPSLALKLVLYFLLSGEAIDCLRRLPNRPTYMTEVAA